MWVHVFFIFQELTCHSQVELDQLATSSSIDDSFRVAVSRDLLLRRWAAPSTATAWEEAGRPLCSAESERIGDGLSHHCQIWSGSSRYRVVEIGRVLAAQRQGEAERSGSVAATVAEEGSGDSCRTLPEEQLLAAVDPHVKKKKKKSGLRCQDPFD